MPNRYCNLTPTAKIQDDFGRITDGFSLVDIDVAALQVDPTDRINRVRQILNRVRNTERTFTIKTRQYTWLRNLSTTLLNGAKSTSTDGSATTIWYPDGAAAYGHLWTRDVAYMMEGRPDYFTAAQIKGVFDYIATRVKAITYEVPDHISQNGTIYWTPGSTNDWGSRAPVDGNAFLVDIAWHHYKKTGSPTVYNLNRTLLDNVMEIGIPYNPTTGCVTISDSSPFVGYGFMDTVKLTGDVLFPSVLAYKAYLQMADMAYANGDRGKAKYYLNRADTIKTGVQTTLWNGVNQPVGNYTGPIGFYRSATIKGSGQDDLWGSAFAVWMGLASDEHAYAIAKNFESNFNAPTDQYQQTGGIRHVLKAQDTASGVNVWPFYFSPVTYGTYQNGGYWPTPLPWVCYALSLVNPDLARQLLDDAIKRFIADGANAPYEWWNGGNLGVAKYCSSATLPLLIAEREQHGLWSQIKSSVSTGIPAGSTDIVVNFDTPFEHDLLMATVQITSTTTLPFYWFTLKIISRSTTGVTVRVHNDGGGADGGVVFEVQGVGY